MALVGDARCTWNTGASIHDLAMVFQAKRPLLGPRVKQRVSRDGTVIHKVRAGAGVYDAIVTLRYEPHSATFMAFLIAAVMEGEEIRYIPSNGTPGEYDDFTVVSPLSIDSIRHAADYPFYLEFDFEMRIRKTDGSDWDYLFA